MRASAFAFLLMSLPAMVVAAPVHRIEGFDASLIQHDEPGLRLPGEIGYGSAAANRENDNRIFDLRPQADGELAAPGLSFGLIHAESEIVNGRRRMHYRIDGFTVMGGEVGGSIGHRGAILTLHWGN